MTLPPNHELALLVIKGFKEASTYNPSISIYRNDNGDLLRYLDGKWSYWLKARFTPIPVNSLKEGFIEIENSYEKPMFNKYGN